MQQHMYNIMYIIYDGREQNANFVVLVLLIAKFCL